MNRHRIPFLIEFERYNKENRALFCMGIGKYRAAKIKANFHCRINKIENKKAPAG